MTQGGNLSTGIHTKDFSLIKASATDIKNKETGWLTDGYFGTEYNDYGISKWSYLAGNWNVRQKLRRELEWR